MLRLGLLKVPTPDLAQAIPFYTTLLDRTPEFVAEEFGWAQFGGDPALALYVPGQGGGDRPPGGSVDFHLVHSDIDALCATLIQKHPEAGAGIHENADGSRSLECRDPAGNLLKIMG